MMLSSARSDAEFLRNRGMVIQIPVGEDGGFPAANIDIDACPWLLAVEIKRIYHKPLSTHRSPASAGRRSLR